MIAPHEEEQYFNWWLREEALDWQSLQEEYKDVLMQIPRAEGLDEFHRCGIVTASGEQLPQSA